MHDAQSGQSTGLISGFCAILGLPNVGKSTLMNRILGVRLVAVSNKPQTTRNRIVGVHNTALAAADGAAARAQIVFVDTPGLQRGKGPLRRYMREQALAAAADSDVALVLIDATDSAQRTPARLAAHENGALAESLSRLSSPALLAINKIDRLADKAEILPIIAAYGGDDRFGDIVPVSAMKGEGLEQLVAAIAARLPEGPQLFPDDMVTDRAEQFLAAELIREQLFRQLGKEVPYATAVQVESFTERPHKQDVVIEAVIFVERDSQKGIVVGKGGARIREVGLQARRAIAELLGCEVHVKLYVKVATDWSRGEGGIRRMGYE